ncbi:mannitol-1-phosphate 5-dehydrogenase [Salipaludibacillus sp. CF4.18]|uniref:mannitol-1-phosphate 5-dehydrogenase n=1 Tax=Salipaludibacillus sp. CF4.18 TaxID=3373081 RepID=UPI003EE5780E
MKALHFGAGNIGRGFIGKILADAGYSITFVDVNHEVIDALNEMNSYHVHYAEEDKRSFEITNVQGLHSQKDESHVIEAIASADLVTTAVGAHILPHIAATLAKGLVSRSTSHPPLNVVACENALGGTDLLKAEVEKHLSSEDWDHVSKIVGFPNAAVDRIVPIQNQTNLLDVLVEPFFEWVVERKNLKGDLPPVTDIHFVDDLEAYIERKLFTVNTGHAATAYFGYLDNKKTIQEVLEDEAIKRQVRSVLEETGRLICEKHTFDSEDHERYIEKILQRFLNPFIVDEVTRVARQPIKKLGHNERLVSPAVQLLDKGIEIDALYDVIVAALKFDYPQDNEAEELQKKLNDSGIQKAFSSISGLAEDHTIVKEVARRYAQ